MSKWLEEHNAFMAKYPDCPTPEPIACLDLIMQSEWARKIKLGSKTIEFRDFSEHYCKRLYDKKVLDYINTHKNDKEFMKGVGTHVSPLRKVHRIHFHNYNNSWFMDVLVTINGVVRVNEKEVKALQDMFNCHDLDDELEEFRGKKNAPAYFYFVCRKVLDTNL